MARFKKTRARKASNNTTRDTKPSHLSMQQEARNTEGGNFWRSNIQFRHKAVHFVSAGNLEPAQEPKPDKTIREAPIEKISCAPDTENVPEPKDKTEPPADSPTPTSPVLPAQPHPTTCEDSSEDEVIFRGRRREPAMGSCIVSHSGIVDGSPLNTELAKGSSSPAHLPAVSLATPAIDELPIRPQDPPADWVPVNDDIANSHLDMSDEDHILADYIAHMEDDVTEDESTCSSSDHHREVDESRPISVGLARTPTDDESEEGDSDIQHLMPGELPETEPHFSLSDPPVSARRKADMNLIAPATAFADALELDPYYGLDVMDFNRPSLRKKKNKQATFGLDAYDTELEDDLLNAWNNDRLKKKSKKREREELRAQGLLGRHKNDPDLKTKYADGIDIEDLKSEIRSFLMSSKNSLPLPPMTKHRRILIHDLAHALRLTSQSRGKGSSRFPVLSKTSRTPKYTTKTVSHLERVLSKERFSPRALKAWDKTKTNTRSGKAKRGNNNASYMEGDVVGASAPEIGAENKGRAMLEKMGWSTGTALGATNNKGILLPVAHVVKNSKAGLG